jgi:hypothetical protein
LRTACGVAYAPGKQPQLRERIGRTGHGCATFPPRRTSPSAMQRR